jgi:hypothetical protein
MDKKQIFKYAVWALALYGGYKVAKGIKAKGGVMPFLGLKK